MPHAVADVRVIIASPASATHDSSFSLGACPDPEELLFVAFCKDTEVRADLLERLRAGAKSPGAGDAESLARELERDFGRYWTSGATDDGLVAAVRWWTQARRQPYHAYSLKAGVGPYRTSCLVAFSEPDATTMRFNLARAVDILERERGRVMDFFGWEGSTEGF